MMFSNCDMNKVPIISLTVLKDLMTLRVTLSLNIITRAVWQVLVVQEPRDVFKPLFFFEKCDDVISFICNRHNYDLTNLSVIYVVKLTLLSQSEQRHNATSIARNFNYLLS